MDFIDDSEESRTLFCGNLPAKCTEELLYELFLQAGPLEKVRIPPDREGRSATYGFITFRHQCSVHYAINIFDGITMFKNRLNLRLRNTNNTALSVCNANAVAPAPPVNLHQSNQNQRTPTSGRNDYYRNESLQGRWNNHVYKRDGNMRPADNRRHNYKRQKR